MSSAPLYTEAWLSPPSSSFQFYTRTWAASQPRAAAVFIHGFTEHISRNGYNTGFTVLASKGVTVFAFDQRGFGRTAVASKKRGDGSYARTSGKLALCDIDWAVNHVKREHSDLPVFLLGHSMGGGLSLTACTRSPPLSCVPKLSGVVAFSPLIQLTKPASKVARFIGGKVGVLIPNFIIPVSDDTEGLSRDIAENEAFLNDPLIKSKSTLRQLDNMLNAADELRKIGHRHWPSNLPVLLVHGSVDQKTSPDASRAFYEKISSKDKQFSVYEGGYHELWNEPNGVKEKLAEECAAWILARSFPPNVYAKL